MVTDLSFNIIALDKASATFSKLAEQVDRLAAKVDKLDGKDANVNVNVKTDESTKALDSFTTRFQLMAAGIIAASPLAGAAILGGIGAGFIGIAALAQKSNTDVQKTFTNLWANVVGQTKAATDQLVPQIVGAGRQIDAEITRLGPQMAAGFAAAGPQITALTRGLTEFADNAMPGVLSAMQNSQPVFSATANVMGVLGTAFGDATSSIGQNSSSYAGYVTSLGNITSTVLGTVVALVNDIAQAWSENGPKIDGAISGIGHTITGLASGVLPVFSAALSAAATAVKTITDVLGPLAPILGFVGGAALATWGAFKLAELVSVGVKALALSVVTLGGNMEASAAKAATMIAAQQGVAVSASASAVAIRSAGAAAATAATGFGTVAESLAGPVGLVLIAITAAMALFGSTSDDAGASAAATAADMDTLTSALEKSHGAWDQAATDQLKNSQSFKDALAAGKEFGLTQADLIKMVKEGGPAWDAFLAQLDKVSSKSDDLGLSTGWLTGKLFPAADAALGLGDRASGAAGKLRALKDETSGAATAAGTNTEAQSNAALVMASSAQGTAAAAGISQAFAGTLGSVGRGLYDMGSAAGNAGLSIEQLAVKFRDGQIAIANAETAISDHFKQADQAVASARQSVTDASHSYAAAQRSVADASHSAEAAARAVTQAEQGVADAQHGVMTAERAVQDAVEGVDTARKSYAKSLQAEKQAEADLHTARQQAIQDLKELHLQLEDQVVTEESARVRLFEQTQSAAALGITPQNAKSVAAQTVDSGNIDQVKAAIDLISAQNSLNNALNSGTKIRADVTAAEKAGVEGSKGVISAQNQLEAAHDQVASSARGVVKAQQAVADANYGLAQANRGLQRAQQAVSDAAYAEQRAHQGVADAQYASQRSAQQLTKAKEALTTAEQNASRTLDLSTEAGRRNFAQLKTLSDAITAVYGPTADSYNRIIQQTADKFGITKQAAFDLDKQLGLIPQDFKFDMTAVANVDTASLQAVFRGTSAGGYFNDTMNVKKTIGGTGYATGGPIYGPGGPRDDMVNLWASPGEWIQPADAVDHYGPSFMEAVRTKRLPRFATGGPVDPGQWNAFGAGAGAAYATNINAFQVMGIKHPPQLPKWTPPPVSIGPVGGVSGDRAANKAIVQGVFASMFGWTGAEWDAANALIMGESGYQNTVKNKTSTAYGIFQFLDSTWAGYGIPKTSDPYLQSVAGGRYIKARYGDPINANIFKRAHNWYASGGPVQKHDLAAIAYGSHKVGRFDNGGVLEDGMLGLNTSGKPENVRTSSQEDALVGAVHENTRVLSAAVKALADRPIEGKAVLDTGQVIGMLKRLGDQITTASSGGRL